MQTMLTIALYASALFGADASLAQNTDMMRGGGWGMSGMGWMGGYGGPWVPLLVVLIVIGLVVWFLQQKRK